MSRAFTKEDDSLEAPIIPPRPALPPGTPNYMTPQGLEQLRAELAGLEAERTQATHRENEADRTRQLTVLNARITALNHRIATAKVVNPANQPPDEIRFGATVVLRTRSGGTPGFERRFRVVGVDEASVAEGKVAFVAPMARAIAGARLGETVTLRLGPKEEAVEVVAIAYEE
jgi:transcription elongation factor GreB